ncbi:MAG: hypothetical protein KAS72_09835 [Phycisphaerales bacterium]|nr:hypothetical protein [Phycisphaerales bacterium]
MSDSIATSDSPPKAGAFAGFLACGLFAQTAQVLLLRELLVVLDGDELALGVMLAAWLVFVGLGAMMMRGGTNTDRPIRRYAVVLAVAIASVPPALVLVRLGREVFDAPLGTPLGLGPTIALSCAASAIPAVCTGMLFPLMVRTARARAGTTYGGESLGALVGGLLLVFVFIGHISPMGIAAGVGAIAAGGGVMLVGSIRPVRLGAWIALIGVMLCCAVGAVLGGRADAVLEERRWANAVPGHELLAVRESPYGRYAALRRSSQLSLFLDGHLQYDVPDPYGAGALVHTALLQHPQPRSILLIGAGPAGNVHHALAHHPQRIDCVELDPTPMRMLQAYGPPGVLAGFDAPQVRVHHVDPAMMLNRSAQLYDAIIMQVGDPDTLGLGRLYAKGFIETLAAHLTPGGVLAISISSQSDYLGPLVRQRNAVVYHTIRRVLPETIATPGEQCLVIARKSSSDDDESRIVLDTGELAGRLTERGVDALPYLAMLYTDPFPAGRTAAVNDSLASWPDEAEEFSPLDEGEVVHGGVVGVVGVGVPHANPAATVNTELVPRAYWFSRLAKTGKYEPGLLPIVEALPATVRWILGVAAAAGLLIAARVRRGGGGRSLRLGLTCISGAFAFAIMAMQVVVVLWYQSILGQMYIGIALLSAAFMAGLGAGSLAASVLRTQWSGVMGVQAVLLAFAALWIMLGSLVAPTAVGVVATIGASLLGALLGIHFACCCTLWGCDSSDAAGAARWLYAADLIGGAAAALVVAAVIVPADGVAAALLWAAAFTIVGLAVARRLRTTVHTPG